MTDLQREWEDILESHGLLADRGDTVLDQTTYLGNPGAYTDEKSEYSTFIDSVRAEPKAWWLEPSRPVVPIRIITPEELRALDPGVLRRSAHQAPLQRLLVRIAGRTLSRKAPHRRAQPQD
jgi:hypothetical protein